VDNNNLSFRSKIEKRIDKLRQETEKMYDELDESRNFLLKIASDGKVHYPFL